MKVTTVSASVRFSGNVGDSRFKTIELSAEATVNGQETWQAAQGQLYSELGQQLKALWGQCNGKATAATTQAPETPQVPEPPEPPAHYCQQHQAEFKRYSRSDSVWYSHKTAEGKWCKEK